ncbi:MAG: Ig-like domain-containing protein [Cyanobacteria bacterium J06627_28]
MTVDDVVDNTAPVAADDSFTVNENTVLNGDVSGNDTDTEGDASYALDADAANGTVALAADGSFTYTPDADFNGTDSFTYTLSDAEFSSTATVNVTVDDVVVADPVVSFSTTSGTLSEAAGDELVLSFEVDGAIPPVVLDDEGNYVSGGIVVNLEGDMAEILQQFLAPDGDGAVQTRVSDDGVNVFYRFDTSFGPGAGLEGGILDVFSLEDGDPAEGSSDPAAAGTGFLSNFSFIITDPTASITLPVSDDIVQEEDKTFSYTLVDGAGYTVDPAQNSGTFTVTDGVAPATSPTVGVTASETTLIEDEQTRTTITFTTDGDIPDGGLLVQLKGPVRSIAEFDVNGNNNTQPRDPEGELVVTGPVVTGGNIAGTDEVAGSVFFRITEATASIDVAVFDDDVPEGTENFTFSLVDGEEYEVDGANSGIDLTIEDESVVVADPVVSFSTTSGTLSEAAGDELVLSFAVDGTIPPVVLDDEGNYVSGGIAVNLEGDMAEILQQFLAPDGDGAVQTRVSDDGVNVFYRFDTSFGPGAGLEGGILEVFSLEDGDPAEGSSDPAAAGTGFLSNFSFIITEPTASITLPVSDDIVQEEDKTFSYTLVGGEGYTVDVGQNSGTFTVTDGVAPATSPVVGVTASETTLIEDEQTRTTVTFTTTGDIPPEGLLVQLQGPPRAVAEFDVNGTNNTQPRLPEDELVLAGPVVTGGNIAGTDEVAGSVFFRITEATASIDIAVFDDDVEEGSESLSFSLVDGEDYEIDAANSGVNFTILDEPVVVADPVVSFSITPSLVSEDGDDQTLSLIWEVDGEIPDPVFDADGNYVSGALPVTVAGDFLTLFDPELRLLDDNVGIIFDPPTGLIPIENRGSEVVVGLTAPMVTASVTIFDDILEEDPLDLTFQLLDGDGYVVDGDGIATATVVDGDSVIPGSGPTVSISVSDTDLVEGEAFTVSFDVDGDIPDGGLTVFVDGPPAALSEFVIFNEDGSPAVATEGIAEFPAPDNDAGGFFVTLTENQASLTLSVFDDGPGEGPEDLTFNLIDGEEYEVSDTNGSISFTINDSDVSGDPVVSFSTTSGTLSEAAGDELALSFAVDGTIPPVVLDDEGNYVSGGIAVNLEGDMAEILQQFLAPDGDGAVQTRVSDDGVNVFYRFDTSFGPGAGLEGGILDVFSLEDGDPDEGSSDPAAAGTGFLSNFSFIITDPTASITLPVSDDIVQEEDQTFSYTLVDGAGYTVDPTQNSGTFTVTDGVDPATSPTVGVTASETTLIEDEQTRTTITFTTEGDIPPEGLLVQLRGPVRSIAEFDVNGTNNTQPRLSEDELVLAGPVVTGGNIAGTDEVAGSVFFRITEATSSIDVAVFDDDVAEGIENFTFSLVDGEDYEVDTANSGIDITIEDGIVDPVVPEVSLFIEPDLLSEEDADTTLVSVGFSVDGVIPEGGLSVLVTGSVDILDQVDGARDIAFNNAVLGDFFDPATGTFEVIISDNSGSIDLPILNDVIQEEDQDFSFTLVENDAGAIDATYTLNPAANTDTVTLIDGNGGPGVGPTVGISVSETSLNEGDTFTVNFTVDGDIPDGGLTVLVDSPTPRSIGEFVIFNEDGSPAVEFEGIAGFPEVGDSGASSFLVTLTEPTSSLTLSVFEDGPNEGLETFTFNLVDGEVYEVAPDASSFTFTINDFETVGTDESDRLVGDDMDNSIDGQGGSDIIAGGLANDIILGGDGNDVLRGDLNSRNTQDDIAGGNDIIFGGDGNDRIGGKAGNDILSGDAGDDFIWGDDGDDIIMGVTGNDTLVGDNGSKGSGSDLFVFGNGDGTDTIVDFEVGIDRIGLVEGELTFADLTITQDGSNALLGVTSSGETLAVLNNVDASDLTQSSFEIVADVSNLDDALALI